jgi:hypothetical protein
MSGFIILVVGEGIRLLRLMQREAAPPYLSSGGAFRREAVQWCVLLAIIAFVITLRDRVVEVLLVVSFIVGLALNFQRAGAPRGAWLNR